MRTFRLATIPNSTFHRIQNEHTTLAFVWAYFALLDDQKVAFTIDTKAISKFLEEANRCAENQIIVGCVNSLKSRNILRQHKLSRDKQNPLFELVHKPSTERPIPVKDFRNWMSLPNAKPYASIFDYPRTNEAKSYQTTGGAKKSFLRKGRKSPFGDSKLGSRSQVRTRPVHLEGLRRKIRYERKIILWADRVEKLALRETKKKGPADVFCGAILNGAGGKFKLR